MADGGIGVILDGGGENTYEFDYLSHGGGYWCGLGFARDFGGNTKRLITRTAYNGGPRTQPSFQRFGCGWGCHYAMGFLFDDSGDDVYEGTIMGTGMAWDCSMGVLCDFAGNDHYMATGGSTQGTGAQMGFGILFDYKGDDVYEGYGQGYASPEHFVPPFARVRRQLQLPDRLWRQGHLRLRRREQQLYPTRRCGRIPDRPAAPRGSRKRRRRRRCRTERPDRKTVISSETAGQRGSQTDQLHAGGLPMIRVQQILTVAILTVGLLLSGRALDSAENATRLNRAA